MNIKKEISDYQHIIFDFDRTIGSLVINWNTWRSILHTEIKKYDPTFSDSIKSIKHANQNTYIKKYGKEMVDILNNSNQKVEEEFVERFEENKAIVNFIQTTSQTISIWSSNSRVTVEKYINKLDISKKLERIVTRDEVYYLKPEIDGFLIINKNNNPREQFLFIGDAQSDKEAAQKAEIDFMYVDEFVSMLQ